MRQVFLAVDTIEEMLAQAPWAARVYLCDGGVMAFEDVEEAQRWLHQEMVGYNDEM